MLQRARSDSDRKSTRHFMFSRSVYASSRPKSNYDSLRASVIQSAEDRLTLMKARIKWIEKAKFLGETGSGHSVVMDGPPEDGGENLGIRPMEMVLTGLGGESERIV